MIHANMECPAILAFYFIFFFNDTATTEIYTLSLHDALPISGGVDHLDRRGGRARGGLAVPGLDRRGQDRKSTRLNSSHMSISYAVFCLKKKNMTDKMYLHIFS